MSQTKKIGAAFVAMLWTLSAIVISGGNEAALATGVNTNITSVGYLYIQNYANDGIDRYNLATGQVEAVNLSDSSCQALDRDEIYDVAPDETHYKLYWSNFQSGSNPNYRTQLNVIDLKTGICTGLVSKTFVYSAGGERFAFTGLSLDQPHNRLYYSDEGGAQTVNLDAWHNRNRSLGYLDLSASVGSQQHTIELTNAQYTMTVGFARDVVLDGDYIYIVGKNFISPNVKDSGDGVFKARVTTSNVVATTTAISTVVNYEDNDTDISQVDVRGNYVYFTAKGNTADYNLGILKLNKTEEYPTPVTVLGPSNGQPNPTGTRTYTGFALGQGDDMFSIDFTTGWGPMGFYSSDDGANAQPLSGTYNASGSYWGLPSYSSGMLPNAPTITTVSRTADATATMNFTSPTGADSDGIYSWVAKPVGGGSDLTDTCTTSPCSITGLAAGVHYNFQLLHKFRNAAGQAIVQSNYSAAVLDATPPASAVNAFSGFPTMRSVLSKTQKTALRTWLNANPSMTSATCVGQVGYNWANVSKTELKSLAKNRAIAVCGYLKSLRPALSTHISTSVISKSKQSTIRKVTVTLQ
jgi:hypothetical protein